MTKFVLSRPGAPWDYATLGFTADADGAILDGTLFDPDLTIPPDAYWSVYGGGSAETNITRYATPNEAFLDPTPEITAGWVLAYDTDANTFVPTAPTVLSLVWTADTVVSTGAVRQAPDGSWIKSTGNRTTRPSFDTTEATFWEAVLASSGTVEATALADAIDARAVRKYAVTINVRDYGAVGDRTTNDDTAIDAAIAAAIALPVNPLTGTDTARLLFPDGDYLITTGKVFPENVIPYMEGSARFVYEGTGTAITFYRWANNSMAYQGDVRVSVDRTTPTWAKADTTSVGILFDTCWRMRVNVGNIRNFHTQVRCHGNGAVGWGGTSYIDLILGYLLNGKIGIDATVENGGYVTAVNTFGGVISLRDTGQTARINLFTDPSVTGTAALAQYNGVGGAGAFTAPTSGGWSGTSFGRLTWSTVPSSSGGFKTGAKVAATPGTGYIASAYIRPSRTLNLAASRQWYNSGTPTTTSTGSTVSCPAGQWTRVSLAATCPTGSNEFEQRFYIVGAGITTIGDTLDIDGVLIETGSTLLDWFDGGSTGGSWTGAANASTSTLSINAGTRYLRGPLAWCNFHGTMLEGATVEKAVEISEDHNTFFGTSFEAVVAGGVEMSGLTGNAFFNCMGVTAFGTTLVDTNGSCTVIGGDGARHVGKVTAADGLGVGNSAAATTPGTVVKKMEVFDADGASIGFVPVYDAIT